MAESTAAQALLRVHNVGVRFGGIVALDDVSFDVARNCIVGLIGPNGAGKTTLFNCVSRLYQCDCGDIVFDGRSLLCVPRHRIAALGIGRTFQNLALFGTMTVLDNVMIEHHMNLVMSISDLVVALDFGRKIAEGTPDEVRACPEVIQAYLGSAH